jgi:hypothetical protein
MSYFRVIPRDLFNEANLLKCYGQLYLNLEKMGLQDCLVHSSERARWDVQQDSSSGAITILNIILFVKGNNVYLSRPLNSREPWPLYLEHADDVLAVFNDDGTFSSEMIAFLKR